MCSSEVSQVTHCRVLHSAGIPWKAEVKVVARTKVALDSYGDSGSHLAGCDLTPNRIFASHKAKQTPTFQK